MPERGNPLILAVDDDPDILQFIAIVLEAEGCRVETAATAERALSVLEDRTPGLILLDIDMPGTDGFELCEAILARPEMAHVPIVFATAREQEQDKARALALGAADYLLKPLGRRSLAETVRERLRASRSWRAALHSIPSTGSASHLQRRTDLAAFRDHLAGQLHLSPERRAALEGLGPESIDDLPGELGLDDVELARMMADFVGCPYIESLEPERIRLGVLPASFCRSNRIVPYEDEDGLETFAVTSPFSWNVQDALNRMVGQRSPRLSIATRRTIDRLLDPIGGRRRSRSAGDESNPMSISEIEEEVARNLGLRTDLVGEAETGPQAAPLVQLANRLIEGGFEMGASDIHIEPQEDEVIVRYRVDGVLRIVHRLRPPQLIRPLTSRIKVMSQLDISERRLPQDGRIVFKEHCRGRLDFDLRVSTAPMNYGEKIVMRILDKQRSVLPLEDLGLSPRHLAIYREEIKSPHGMILHVGPTGSGKSMTLYAALNELRSPELNIQTAEDPIEYTLPGINQLQVASSIGLTFQRALRSFLRQDPDVILVGEIRDLETAQIAVEASLTGHLLLSTLHTNDAAGTITRFLEMGIEPAMISSSIILICAQRLLRRLCRACRRPVSEDDRAMLTRLGLTESTAGEAQAPVGCPACNGIGYRGRVGIHEILVPNDNLRRAINSPAIDAEQLHRKAVEECGMTTLFRDAIEKVQAGVCSASDVLLKVNRTESEDLP